MPLAISSSDTQCSSNHYGLFWILKKVPKKNISHFIIFQNYWGPLIKLPSLKNMQHCLYLFYPKRRTVHKGLTWCWCLWVSRERERRWKNRVCMYLVRYLTPFSYEKNNRPLGESKSLNKKSLGRAVENMIFSI